MKRIDDTHTNPRGIKKKIRKKFKYVHSEVKCPVEHKLATYHEYQAMGYRMMQESNPGAARRCFKLSMNLYLNRIGFIGVDNDERAKGYEFVRARDTGRRLVQQHAPSAYYPELQDEDEEYYKNAVNIAMKSTSTPTSFSPDAPFLKSPTSSSSSSSSLSSSSSEKGDGHAGKEGDAERKKKNFEGGKKKLKEWRLPHNTTDWWQKHSKTATQTARTYDAQLQEQRAALGKP